MSVGAIGTGGKQHTMRTPSWMSCGMSSDNRSIRQGRHQAQAPTGFPTSFKRTAPRCSVEVYKNCLEETTDHFRMTAGCWYVYSQRTELSYHHQVQKHRFAECREKARLLHSGKEIDQLPHGLILVPDPNQRGVLSNFSEREEWFACMVYGSVPHRMIDFGLEFFRVRVLCKTWLSDTSATCTYAQPASEGLQDRMETTRIRSSYGMLHLPHPIHDSLQGNPQRLHEYRISPLSLSHTAAPNELPNFYRTLSPDWPEPPVLLYMLIKVKKRIMDTLKRK